MRYLRAFGAVARGVSTPGRSIPLLSLSLLLTSGGLSTQRADAQGKMRLAARSDVPISVSIVKENEITQLPATLRDVSDIVNLTPGMFGNRPTQITIRGYRPEGATVDGLYLTPAAFDANVCDRIEVLRGSGDCALYGRAATGGTIVANLRNRSLEAERPDRMADDGMAGGAKGAHDPSWAFDVRAGLAVPLGELGDFEGSGLSLGAGSGYYFSPCLSGRLDLDLNFLGGKTFDDEIVFEGPGLNAYHLLGGLNYRVTPATSGLFVDLYAGAGLARLSFDGGDSETKFDYAGAIKVGTAISDNSDIALRAKLHRVDSGNGTWSIGQLQVVYQIRK